MACRLALAALPRRTVAKWSIMRIGSALTLDEVSKQKAFDWCSSLNNNCWFCVSR